MKKVEDFNVGWGGKREGAGRKPKAERYADAMERAEDRIAERATDLVDALLVLALGGWEREERSTNAKGETTTRTVVMPADREAGKYLLDRLLGRPVEHIEQVEVEQEASPLEQMLEALRAEGWDV